MKKFITYILLITLCVGCVAVLSSCAKPSDFLNELEEIKPSSYIVNGKTSKKPNLSSDKAGSITAKFDKATTFNTSYIKVSGKGVEEFEIYADINGTDTLIYKQDYIDKARYATFAPVTTNELTVKITKTSGKYSIKDLVFANVKTNAEDFRVTGYIVCDEYRFHSYDEVDLGHFATLTDIILFGTVRFNTNGELVYTENGKKFDKNAPIPENDRLTNALSFIKRAEKELNKDYNIYVNFLIVDNPNLPSDWNKRMDAQADEHIKAMKDNRDILTDNLVSFTQKYNVDGVSFDWEYPMKKSHYNEYGEFILALKDKMPNIKVAVALAPWGIKFKQKYLDAIDVIELMSYDLADEKGNHSNFYEQTIEAINYAVSAGIPKDKIDLGLAFYARPTTMDAVWEDYSKYAEQLGKYGNLVQNVTLTNEDGSVYFKGDIYFNGWQMIHDRTAYAIDAGIGGVMMWHYGCDLPSTNELSLFNAIKASINSRK